VARNRKRLIGIGSKDMTEYAIQIAGVQKTYAATRSAGPKVALKGIDLNIPKGSIFGLLGPNGAGKSTLINILAGLVVKSAGSVRIWGFDQDINPRQSRAAIGVVPQELNLDAFLTPRESLDLQAGLYGVPKRERRTDEILAAIGLADKANAYSRSLSGGMRRRLLLGKAMVHAPQVLVLDEPTAGVDIELRRMLWAYVRELNATGVTIILTTHYLEEAEQMCDQIAIIDQGQIVAQDSTANLVASMDAKTLVITSQDTLPKIKGLPKGVTENRRPDGRLALTYSRSQHRVEELLNAVHASGIAIRDIATEEPALEDVFLSLTGSKRVAGAA
jgi:ABC-2 type transport system ATP-binding protein